MRKRLMTTDLMHAGGGKVLLTQYEFAKLENQIEQSGQHVLIPE